MRAIAIFSPTSQAGKSWFATAVCRWLAREGWRVAPFQSEADVGSVYMTDQGNAISFTSAWQSWASGIELTTNLNPVLLQPLSSSPNSYQLQIQGKPINRISHSEYYQNYASMVRPIIYECFDQLSASYDLIVCDTYHYGLYNPLLEGTDANFELLARSSLEIAGVIVVDCQHGGAVNQLWGFWQRLNKRNQQYIRGIVFNQFDGDQQIFELEKRWIQDHLKVPVLGFLPPLPLSLYNPNSPILFESEVDQKSSQHGIKIVVVRLPNLTHYSDFDALESEPSIQLTYLDPSERLGYPDAVIVPDTKDAISDLQFLISHSFQIQLQNYAAAGGTVIGLCEGANLLSQKIIIDTNPNAYKPIVQPALGLIRYDCYVQSRLIKKAQQTTSKHPFPNLPAQGEEIHQGVMKFTENDGYYPLFELSHLGIVNKENNVWASYLHRLFDNGPWRRFWLNQLRQKRGFSSLPTGIGDFQARKENILNALADHIENHLELPRLLTDYDL